MAAIRERGGRFHVQVRMVGFPSRTESFPTRRLAERWAKTIEAEMIEGRAFRSVEARRRTLADAIDRYILEELPQKGDARTRVIRLRWWREQLGHLKLADVTSAKLVEYRNRLLRESYTKAKPGAKRSTLEAGKKAQGYTRTPSTVNRYISYLQHVFSIARREWHWVSANPFDGVGKFKENKGRVRYLSEEERERLLRETAKNPQLHVLVMLALSTTARAGELLRLTWRDVDLKDGRLDLRKTKNGQPRTAWVRGEALRLLKEHARLRRLGDDRLFVSQKGKHYDYGPDFEAACAAAHVLDFVFHDLRHSSATYLARAGASEQQLKAIGGWKSGVVSRYVHIAAEDARGVVEKMNEQVFGK